MHESLVTTVGLVTKIQSVETGKKKVQLIDMTGPRNLERYISGNRQNNLSLLLCQTPNNPSLAKGILDEVLPK